MCKSMVEMYCYKMDHDVNSANVIQQAQIGFFRLTAFAVLRGMWIVGIKIWEHLKVMTNCLPCLRDRNCSDDQPLTSNNISMSGSISHLGGMVSNQNQHPIVSECYHSDPSKEAGNRYPIAPPDTTFNNRLFALVIGINKYQDKKIRNLKGCIKDSENVCRFLTQTLHANPLHIKHLRDAEATREGILSTFKEHFINNKGIHQNDAIVFYFAGHGSYEAFEENSLTRNMETICPYDDRAGERLRGIPDRTIAALMKQLASIKGNNITAIFDSCHSGGMGRRPDSDLENSRLLEPPHSRFPNGLDEDIWNLDCPRSTTRIQDPHLPYSPQTSHVLLAACQRDELAYETPLRTGGYYGGAFTSLLLELLRQSGRNLTETTYIGLFHTLQQPQYKSRLPKQTPYVEGDNKTRILFNMTDTGRQFPVLLSGDGKFSVTAGTIHGVDEETEFTITSGKECFKGLKPLHCSSLSSSFNKIDDMNLRDDSRAEVTKWNRPHSKVFIQQQTCDGPSDSQDYDVIVSQNAEKRMKVERRDELIPCYTDNDITLENVVLFDAQNCAGGHSLPTAQTFAIINAITHFNFHLLRQSDSKSIGEKLTVKLERLSQRYGVSGENSDISYFPAENEENFFTRESLTLKPQANIKQGSLKVTAAVNLPNLNDLYSFTLRICDVPQTDTFFPYVFGFDAATYEIASFYHPEPTRDGPLRAGREVTIGYGHDGGDPIIFYPNEVTFFKVFVTSKYVDLHGLEQKPPFRGGAGLLGRQGQHAIPDVFWESWIYIVKT